MADNKWDLSGIKLGNFGKFAEKQWEDGSLSIDDILTRKVVLTGNKGAFTERTNYDIMRLADFLTISYTPVKIDTAIMGISDKEAMYDICVEVALANGKMDKGAWTGLVSLGDDLDISVFTQEQIIYERAYKLKLEEFKERLKKQWMGKKKKTLQEAKAYLAECDDLGIDYEHFSAVKLEAAIAAAEVLHITPEYVTALEFEGRTQKISYLNSEYLKAIIKMIYDKDEMTLNKYMGLFELKFIKPGHDDGEKLDAQNFAEAEKTVLEEGGGLTTGS
jgi:hypothetical protein